jgi:pimeloyl-ACP methyl ester carboxylesterase
VSRRVLYLHGFASTPKSKKAQFFKKKFEECGIVAEIPALDEGDFEHLTISGQLRVVEREARGEPVTLMGSSMGGYLAALYASRHPEVERLILLAPAFGFAQRWSAGLGERGMAEWRETNKLAVFHYGEMRETELAFDLMRDALGYEEYPDARQPAVIFHGVHDEVVPVRFAEEFARRHPETASLHKLESDHELIDVLDDLWEHTRRFMGC